mgnify:CR=1 FL=1
MAAETLTFSAVFPPALLSLVSVAALVLSDYHNRRPGRYLFKPLAAAAFIWLALQLDALSRSYGTWMLVGLCLCMLGDLFLMPDNERWFLAGLVAFLCGHLVYAAAFVQLSFYPWGVAISALPALVLLVQVLRWLLPHVDSNMKIPVALYTVVITCMLLFAGGTAGSTAAYLIILGAWAFALSDIAVARRQFVASDPVNQLWGTPLYFLAQMILAASIAA